MEQVCPEIGSLTTCYSCGDQCLPPYRLCKEAHVACHPCAGHRRRCECGRRFARGPHLSYDWLMSAMGHRCKYRIAGRLAQRPAVGNGEFSCPDRWYTVQELRDHYRGPCLRNVYACDINGCGRVCRVDTVVDHYESAHGPFETAVPDPTQPHVVTVSVPFDSEVVRKIFNGYISFFVGPPPTAERSYVEVIMKNINPADLLNYQLELHQHTSIDEIFVTITVKNMNSDDYSDSNERNETSPPVIL